MRKLLRTLQDQDPGFLRAVHELWGLDAPTGSAHDLSLNLESNMLQAELLNELIDSLTDPAKELLDHLIEDGGKAPFAQIERKYGPLREMGPGRRDREKPWRHPASALEILWYRGLIARAFADSPVGPQEFIFIPSDLLPFLSASSTNTTSLMGLESEVPKFVQAANSTAVDDATTLLSAFRKKPPTGTPIPPQRSASLMRHLHQKASIEMLVHLLVELDLLKKDSLKPIPENVGRFLESSRKRALLMLITAWRDSNRWNDLAALKHLQVASADWPNDARLSRAAALELLRPVPIGEWWDLNSFIADVRVHQPAFQRPGGDFQAWYLQDGSGAFLNGIEHWDSVDGAYLRHLIQGPAHWLGMVDLGSPSPDSPVRCFRLTQAWAALYSVDPLLNIEEPDSQITVHSNGEVIVPRGADRVTRYQIARISAWEQPDEMGYHFRLTPRTLQLAHEQGLNANHILQLLEKAAGDELPPSVLRAVERWSRAGTEARLTQDLLLRVQRPEIMDTLSDHKTTARYLGEILSPTVAVVRAADWMALQDAAARLGLLIDPPNRFKPEQ